MVTMTKEDVTDLMMRMSEENNRMIKELMVEVMAKRDGGGLVDTRGVGKPPVFKGIEDKYPEWMAKMLAYLRAVNPEAADWIKWAMNHNDPASDEEIKIK